MMAQFIWKFSPFTKMGVRVVIYAYFLNAVLLNQPIKVKGPCV
jgi:hypothetical protein